jgi:hypothetical protein
LASEVVEESPLEEVGLAFLRVVPVVGEEEAFQLWEASLEDQVVEVEHCHLELVFIPVAVEAVESLLPLEELMGLSHRPL